MGGERTKVDVRNGENRSSPVKRCARHGIYTNRGNEFSGVAMENENVVDDDANCTVCVNVGRTDF